MELEKDICIQCDKRGSIINILKDQIAFNVYRYEHGDNGMGDEMEYHYEDVIECDNCGNEILFKISGLEYPAGAFDYEYNEIKGGNFIREPHMIIVYSVDEFYPSDAISEYDRIQKLVLNIAQDEKLIYDISSREFEEIIERIFQNEGFETVLTQATRDGGRDIIATIYEMGNPIVFYIECKKYGQKNNVGVSIVRELYGVQTADRINKSILITTGHITRETRKFVDEQNTMMSIIDVNEVHRLIRRSADKYRNKLYGNKTESC